MKPTLPSLIIGAAIILGSPLHAQSSFDPTGAAAEAHLPRHIRTQVEYIEMTQEQMSALLANPEATKNDATLRQHVSELVKEDKAKIIETQMVIARSGEKATSESIQEYIYPTEYEPAEQVTTVKKEGETDKTVTNKSQAVGPTPTAFEVRNLGSTLEIEPTIGENNQYIDLRLAPEIVYHVENVKWSTWKNQHGEADIKMPTFYSLRTHTSLTLTNKKPCLMAALSPKDDKGFTDFSRKILIFVKCDIIFVGR